jgi:16S rRNA (cytosine1402-N4)-methyltransferase
MNQTGALTAAKIVNEYSEVELVRILKMYGELKNARKVASVILAARAEGAISTTNALRDLLEPMVPQKVSNKFLAQVFQALRIEVNKELDVLVDFMNDSCDVLRPGGRLVVISYHSLEDRIVKNMIQKGSVRGDVEKDFYGNVSVKFKSVGKKVIVPTDEEIKRNSRARSAKLRIAEKV